MKHKADVDFKILECAECGVMFGITDRLFRTRKADHETFHCPHGHGNHFPNRTEAPKGHPESDLIDTETEGLIQ